MYISITNDYIKLIEKVANNLRKDLSPLAELSIILDKGPNYQVVSVSDLAA